MKILIADDFQEVTRFIRNSLNNIGFTNISEADCGKAVLRALKKEKYDLIFCDWNMPDMSGMEVLKKIRSDDELKDIPFIMVTAKAEEEKILNSTSNAKPQKSNRKPKLISAMLFAAEKANQTNEFSLM